MVSAIATPAAQLRGIHKHYRLGEVDVPALRGIDLDLPRGVFSVIGGPSGSGKSTLLNLLGCIDAPDAGSVDVDGQAVAALGDTQRTRFRARHVGFVFQNFNLIPVLTAIENVEYPLRLLEDNAPRRRDMARSALVEVGLEGLEDRPPSALSGGQRQRVAVARALAKRPALVLADEPTANLDQATGRGLIDLMRRIQSATGATFVFSSHDPQLIAEADLRVHLVDGRVTAIDTRGGNA